MKLREKSSGMVGKIVDARKGMLYLNFGGSVDVVVRSGDPNYERVR